MRSGYDKVKAVLLESQLLNSNRGGLHTLDKM
jgi:hypothetical protein